MLTENRGKFLNVAKVHVLCWREGILPIFLLKIMEEVMNQEEEVIREKQTVSGLR